MLNNKVIGLSSAEHLGEIVKPLMSEACVHSIKHGDLLVHNNVRVVRHTVFHNILTFKQVNVMVVDADILYILCNIHYISPFQNRNCYCFIIQSICPLSTHYSKNVTKGKSFFMYYFLRTFRQLNRAIIESMN